MGDGPTCGSGAAFGSGLTWGGCGDRLVKGRRLSGDVDGEGGTRVQLRFGEMLHPDGRLMVENLRKARATDAYILKGTGKDEVWRPRFTYHGFQFVEVTGLKEKPALDAVTGIVLHSDTPLTSSFTCSDPMVNKLYKNIVWTQRANFFEVPTDCPQRDERLGWTGDAQSMCVPQPITPTWPPSSPSGNSTWWNRSATTAPIPPMRRSP